MPIRYPEILALNVAPASVHWTNRDTLLYALGVGCGDDPLDPDSLRFTYERGLLALPTFASTLAGQGEPSAADLGIDVSRMLHAGQKIEILRPLRAQGRASTASHVQLVQDKGVGKGALIVYSVELIDEADGDTIATTTTTLLARGDGGFGGPASVASAPPAAPPGRSPDKLVELVTRPEQALLYRLSGEMNPLHADPELAQAAGFDRPILQGPCSFGMSLRAVLKAWPDLPLDRLRSHEVRFAAAVVPGETLSVRLWREEREVLFEVDVPAKDSTVIRNGRTRFA